MKKLIFLLVQVLTVLMLRPSRMEAKTPTPTQAAVPRAFSLRMNAAGPKYTDDSGNLWKADHAYTPGGFGYLGGGAATNPSGPSPLYQTIRWSNGGFDYKAALHNGKYKVTLKFIENVYSRPGQRVFNLLANGGTIFYHLDIRQWSGGVEIPLDETFTVRVTSGLLDLKFQNLATGAPSVCAVQILRLKPLPTSLMQTPKK